MASICIACAQGSKYQLHNSSHWHSTLKSGFTGTAVQVGFLAPATLLRLLEPKLGACGTSVLLTTTPLHRLGQLDDAEYMMTTWAGASAADTQLALLAYARQMAQHLAGQGMTVAAVDMGKCSAARLMLWKCRVLLVFPLSLSCSGTI